MKPNPKELEEKKIRAVVREIDQLRTVLRNLPSVRLKEPIQRGWVRRYVLTQAAEARPDRDILEAILADIGTEMYSWRPNFMKKRRGSRRLIEMKQSLRRIFVDRWSMKRDPRPEEWKPYFHLEYQPYCGGLYWFYIFTDAHLFELKVEPHWLTHMKVIDPLAIERKAELEAWMEHHLGWKKYERMKGHSRWRELRTMQGKLDRQAKCDLQCFRLNPEEAEMRVPVRWLHFSFFVFPHVAQRRGTPLRTEQVRVQILPWGPLSLLNLAAWEAARWAASKPPAGRNFAGAKFVNPNRRGSRLKIGLVPVRIRPGDPADGSISKEHVPDKRTGTRC